MRQLKASTKDKAVWQPEVNKLLNLKKQLEQAQKNSNSIAASSTTTTQSTSQSVQQLELAVQQQGEKVRQLKASTKDKAVWQPEVNILLDLKKQLAAAQSAAAAPSSVAATPAVGAAGGDVKELEDKIAKQVS